MPTGAHHVERFEHAGATLVDETAGLPSSPHLIFLHGWGATRDSLRGIAALFEPTCRVHLLDLPGFGEAPPPPADWDTIRYTDLVQQYILDRLKGPVVLVGHSFGGRVAVRLAARRLPQISGLVLMAVPGLPRPAFSRGALRRWRIRQLRRVAAVLSSVIGPRPLEWHTKRFGSKDYLAAGNMRPVFVRIVNEDLTETARTVACPTLLLWGSDDGETPLWVASRYRELMGPRAILKVLPHKDHYSYAGTGAHLCAFKIRQWLAEHADA